MCNQWLPGLLIEGESETFSRQVGKDNSTAITDRRAGVMQHAGCGWGRSADLGFPWWPACLGLFNGGTVRDLQRCYCGRFLTLCNYRTAYSRGSLFFILNNSRPGHTQLAIVSGSLRGENSFSERNQ